jgi:hypothetical protein
VNRFPAQGESLYRFTSAFRRSSRLALIAAQERTAQKIQGVPDQPPLAPSDGARGGESDVRSGYWLAVAAALIRPMLPNRPRGIPRFLGGRLGSGAWRDLVLRERGGGQGPPAGAFHEPFSGREPGRPKRKR